MKFSRPVAEKTEPVEVEKIRLMVSISYIFVIRFCDPAGTPRAALISVVRSLLNAEGSGLWLFVKRVWGCARIKNSAERGIMRKAIWDEYRNKLKSADEAAKLVKSGDAVYYSHFVMFPGTSMRLWRSGWARFRMYALSTSAGCTLPRWRLPTRSTNPSSTRLFFQQCRPAAEQEGAVLLRPQQLLRGPQKSLQGRSAQAQCRVHQNDSHGRERILQFRDLRVLYPGRVRSGRNDCRRGQRGRALLPGRCQ